jgi:di/tricarboxylate transporter
MVVMVMLAAIMNIMTATVHSYGKIVHRPHTIKIKLQWKTQKDG